MGGTLGLPPVKLVQDIVNGKSGYVMDLAGQRYRIEPQCNVGESEGVGVASKPDFVIWPWQAGSPRKPIAVFCDGWTYHQHSLREDAAKRSALVASGNYWVWSVTHEDVKMALSSAAGTDLDSPLVALSRHDGSTAPATLARAAQGAFAYNAVFQLLSWLAIPVAPGTPDGAVTQLQRNALWLGYLMVPPNPADLAVVKNEMATWLQQLPVWLQSPGSKHVPSMSRKDAAPVVMSWWPMSCVGGKLDSITSPGVLVLDDRIDQSEQAPHLNWRRWLQLFNTLQTLPGMVATTTSGIHAGDLEMLTAGALQPAAPAGSTDQVALSHQWAEVVEMSVEALRAGLRTLAGLGANAPVVGHELADARGVVIAEAELAWVVHHVVLLTFDQSDLAECWKTAGWQALVLDDGRATVGGIAWTDSACTALGIAVSKNSNSGDTE